MNNISRKLFSGLVVLCLLLASLTPAFAADETFIVRRGQSFARTITPGNTISSYMLTIDGKTAYCIDPNYPTPADGEAYVAENELLDPVVAAIIYNSADNPVTRTGIGVNDYVSTWLAILHQYNAGAASNYESLYQSDLEAKTLFDTAINAVRENPNKYNGIYATVIKYTSAEGGLQKIISAEFNGEISVILRDSSGNVVPNQSVHFSGPVSVDAVTDGAGIASTILPIGDYTVSSQGYNSQAVSLGLGDSEELALTIGQNVIAGGAINVSLSGPQFDGTVVNNGSGLYSFSFTPQPISGATFQIYRDGALVGTLQTSTTGRASAQGLPDGVYTVKHASAEGFVLGADQAVVIENGATASAVFTVERQNPVFGIPVSHQVFSGVSVGPTGLISGTYSTAADNGSTFGLYTAEDRSVTLEDGTTRIVLPKGSLVSVMSTKDGVASTSELLPAGNYYFGLISNPSGQVNPTQIAVGYTPAGNAGTVPISGESINLMIPTGSFVLTDTDPTGKPVVGNTYAIASKDGSVNFSATTNSEGKISATGIPAGDYTYTQTAAPTGYAMTGKVGSFTVTATDTTSSVGSTTDQKEPSKSEQPSRQPCTPDNPCTPENPCPLHDPESPSYVGYSPWDTVTDVTPSGSTTTTDTQTGQTGSTVTTQTPASGTDTVIIEEPLQKKAESNVATGVLSTAGFATIGLLSASGILIVRRKKENK